MEPKKAGIVVLVIVVVVVLGVIGLSSVSTKPASTDTTAGAPATIADPSTLPGIQTTLAPWPAELDNLRARLSAIGLPALAQEGTMLHIHQHLDIYIDGVETQIPAGIGINEAAGFISPIHVHDTTGIVHVESPTVQTFTLGQFFDIWGVELTATSIGGYSNSGDNTLTVYVNGTQYSGDPRGLALAAHQEIVISYGTPSEVPNPLPSSYTFPDGY